MKHPKLTKRNYYDQEFGWRYWSASQVKAFLTCEAAAMAELSGEYTRSSSVSLLVGSYIDTQLTEPKRVESFRAEHPEMFKKDGSLKLDYVRAEAMVQRAKSDEVFMDYLRGQKQKILTGTLFGLPFRAKLDVYRKGQRIVDLKTVKDLEPLYRPGEGRLSPMEYWNWDLQMAIYAALEGNDLPAYLAIITKQDPSDLLLVEVEKHRREACLEYLEERMPRLDAVKQGLIEPQRCENCPWCRRSRKLSAPVPMDEWISSRYDN